ncbi:unnamed protein product, partial [Lymnaea stagnalis]
MAKMKQVVKPTKGSKDKEQGSPRQKSNLDANLDKSVKKKGSGLSNFKNVSPHQSAVGSPHSLKNKEKAQDNTKFTSIENSPKSVSKVKIIDVPKSASKSNLASKEEIKEQSFAMSSKADKVEGTEENMPLSSTPSSSVRRSSRAPVPSSKFKDMEVELVAIKKRSLASSNVSEDSESEQEPPKKRGRKPGEKRHLFNSGVDKVATDVKQPIELCAVSESVATPCTIPSVATQCNIPNTVEEIIESQDNGSGKDLGDSVKIEVMEEDVEIQTTDVTIQTTDHVLQPEIIIGSDSEKVAIEFPTSIEIAGRQITLTEKDGETVAIVSMSSTAQKGSPSEEPSTHAISSMTSLTSEDSEIDQSKSDAIATSSVRHGHIVSKKPDDSPTLGTTGQDGGSFLNLTVEPTNIAAMLKGTQAVSKSMNPVKGHGRVLRSEPNISSIIVKSSLLQPTSSSNITSQSKESLQTFAILTSGPPENPTTPAAYSLPTTPATYSLLMRKSVETDESEHGGVPKNSLHGSIRSSQSPQKVVVVRQQSALKQSDVSDSPWGDGTQKSAAGSNTNAPTIVRFPQDLPTKKGTTTVVHIQRAVSASPAPDSSIRTVVKSIAIPSNASPKSASEMLIQKLSEQHKRVIVRESVNTADSFVQGVETVLPQGEASVQSSSECAHGEVPEEVVLQSQEATCRRISVLQIKKEDLKIDLLRGAKGQLEETDTKNVDDSDTKLTVELLDSDKSAAESSQGQSDFDSSSVEHPVEDSQDESKAEPVLTELKSVEFMSSSDDSTPMDNKSAVSLEDSKQKVKMVVDKIKVVDNGVEYDVRIVGEEEVAEEIVGNSEELEQKESKDHVSENEEGNSGVVLTQEADHDTNTASGKQTSGTQTVYTPQVTLVSQAPSTTTGAPLHTLAKVVDDEGQKKQIYYVSVIPNQGIVRKSKHSSYANDANWVLNDNGMYCCGKCSYKTDRKANLYKHRRLHTGSKPHVCAICQYKAGTSSNLKRHMGIHKDIREHKCDICGLCFRQKIHLERHVKYKHEEKSVQCPMCDYVCANEQPDLKMHMKRKHSSGCSWEVVNCPQCNVEVSNKKDLKQHMKFHKDGPELKLFCKECSFVTDCQSRLKRHVAIHSKLKPFQCGVCNYRAAQKEHVLRHLRTQHKIEVKKESKRPWRRHKNIETDDGSKERADFSSGDKIFACNHCTMRFAKLINLYKHLHTQHVEIMPAETDGNYYCVVCEFSTSSKKNLLVHMRRHNLIDQTPPTHVYSCVLCRYVNPRRRNLFQHMRKKHNIDISSQMEGGAEGEDDGSQDLETADVIKAVNKALTAKGDGAANPGESTEAKDPDVLCNMTHIIKIEDIGTTSTSGEQDDVDNLVIDTQGVGGVTEVIHTTHTVEALEGLQALAEQAGLIDNMIEEQVPI